MLGKVLGSEQESSCLYLHFYYFAYRCQWEMGHSLWSKNPMKDKLLSGYIVSKKCLCPRPAEYKFGLGLDNLGQE